MISGFQGNHKEHKGGEAGKRTGFDRALSGFPAFYRVMVHAFSTQKCQQLLMINDN